MRVKEWQGDVVFLHEVVAGAADRSYGIQVAKLAGLPGAVIERAKIVLAQLESQDRTSPARKLIDDLPLFAATRADACGEVRSGRVGRQRSRRSIPTRCRRARRLKRSMRSSRRRRSLDVRAGA